MAFAFSFSWSQTPIYNLDKIENDYIFYNIVKVNDNIFFGTDRGIITLDENKNLVIHNSNVKGAIDSELKSKNLKIRFITPPINIPLSGYKNSVTDFFQNNQDYFIISRGQLLIFKFNTYYYQAIQNVKSISKNYIGTNDGVYKNNSLVPLSRYSGGKIIEYENVTLICNDGLIQKSGHEETILYDYINEKGKYGKINDAFIINEKNYLIISDKGIYYYNKNQFSLIFPTVKSQIIPARRVSKSGYNDNSAFLFVYEKDLIQINLDDSSTIKKFNFKTNIVDLIINKNEIYAITEGKKMLIIYNDLIEGKTLKEVQLNHNVHSIESFKDFILLTADNGLSIYDTIDQILYPNLLKDHLTKGAIYSNDTIFKIGGPHGIYTYDDKIEQLIKFNAQKIFSGEDESLNSKYFVLIIYSIIIALILILFIRGKTQTTNYSNEELIEKIKNYIDKNLSAVSVQSINENFKINNSAIYHFDNQFRPGDYIKKRRIEVTKSLIKEGASLEKISKISGYSISYIRRKF